MFGKGTGMGVKIQIRRKKNVNVLKRSFFHNEKKRKKKAMETHELNPRKTHSGEYSILMGC